jgi:LacI family transcriptional regulator
MKATLHDVAAHARVSIATVSRALNGLPVSEPNLARVQRAAAELGYVVNQAARGLRSDRTLTIGLIFPRLRAHAGLELLDALAGAVEDRGYTLLVATALGDGARYDLLMRRFLERRVDALVCVHPSGDGETLERYRAADVPVLALFSRPGAFRRVPLVAPSLAGAAERVAKRLAALGHTRVALVLREERTGPILAVCSALKKVGVAIQRHAPGSDPRAIASALATRPDAATAVVAYYRDAVQLLGACRELRLAVPEQLSIKGEQLNLLHVKLRAKGNAAHVVAYCADDRVVTILKGIWWTGEGDRYDPFKMDEYGVGTFYVTKAGTPHFDFARTEVILQVMGFGPIENPVHYLNPDDDPRGN